MDGIMDGIAVEGLIEKSTERLFRQQDGETGGWAERHGICPSTLNTAEAIIALLDSGGASPGNVKIQKGATFLEEKQNPTTGAWPRNYHVIHGENRLIPDPIRTSCAIQALLKTGRRIDSKSIENGINWLISIKNSDNGWGYRPEAPTKILPSCFSLLALIEAHSDGMSKCEQPIKDGLQLLIEKFFNKNSGSFGTSEDKLEATHTIYAVLVLQAARKKSQISGYLSQEKKSLQWLLENQSKARRLVEEIIEIDAEPSGEGNYGFLFMTEPLLIRVLISSEFKEHRESRLARNAMINFGDKMDDNGGFYGHRVFSWSTSQVLCGLGVAKSQFPEIPERNPEYTGTKAGIPIMILAVIELLAVVGLTCVQKFQLFQASIFMVLMFATLLAYDKIGEKTFNEMTKGVVKLFFKT
jgi:hypothetical protein